MWRVELSKRSAFFSSGKKRNTSRKRLGKTMGLVMLVMGGVYLPNLHAQGVDGPQTPSSAHPAPDAIVNNLSLTARILGGGNAEVGEWPSMVAIVIAGNFPLEDRFFCGGTVVAQRWIMTAAHCMFDPFGSATEPGDIRVVAGSNNLQDDNAVETLVTNIFVHPQYDSSGNTLLNDIALLELGTSLSATPTELFSGDPETYNDTMAFIAGWGATTTDSSSSSQYPTLLQDASVPLVPLARCNLPESYQGTITSTQVCAGFRQGGIDSCVGDSGGPLYILDNGRQVQVGITSFGNGCGLPDFYGVYTNVSAFRPWMSNYIDVSVSDNNSASDTGNNSDTGAAETGTDTTDGAITVGGRRKGGAMNLGWLILCGVIAFIGRSFSPASIHLVAPAKRRNKILLVGAVVALSACSTYPPLVDNEGLGVITQEGQDVSKSIERHADTKPLSLASMEGKPGINELLLGADRLDLDQHLVKAGFSEPVCTAEKTALEGTGRLFLREFCDVKPLTQSSLEGMDVNKLSLQFIDNQLIRIDAHMDSGSAMALSKQLNAQYQHMPSATRPFEWRLGDNHIRMMADSTTSSDDVSGVLLQMIDGRLSEKLPALFAYL